MTLKPVIALRKLEIGDIDERNGIIKILKATNLFNTVAKVNQFVKHVFCEFYANLVLELVEQGKSYVRGLLYNDFYASWDYDEEIDTIVAKLLGGQRRIWIKKDTLVMSHS